MVNYSRFCEKAKYSVRHKESKKAANQEQPWGRSEVQGYVYGKEIRLAVTQSGGNAFQRSLTKKQTQFSERRIAASFSSRRDEI